MARFFIAASNIFGGIAYLTKEELDHIKVLRIKSGETFTVCDGNGTDYVCRLSGTDLKGEITAEILDSAPSIGEPSVFCSVYTAFPKGDKAETIVQKSVELGASEIIFYPSARCVSRPDEKSLIKKTARWQKIASEAAKQSGRGKIPTVNTLPSFSAAVGAAAKADLPLFLYEEEQKQGLRDAVSSAASPSTVSIMTGPEGGFEPEEAQLAISSGMKSVTIGPRILRCETAPVCAVTSVMLLTGNLEY